MIRKKLAIMTLIAGMGFLSGCAGSYSFGRLWNGNRFHRAPAADCCPGDYGTVGTYSGFEGGPVLLPQEGVDVIPQGAAPVFTPPPPTAGSTTKVVPIPQSIPVPYTPSGQ